MQPSEPKPSRSRAVSFTWTHRGTTWRWRPNGVELEQPDGTKQLIVIEPDDEPTIDQQKQVHHG